MSFSSGNIARRWWIMSWLSNWRKLWQHDCLIGHGSTNALLNTKIHEVELKNGYIQEYLASTIADNFCAHVDTESNEYVLLQDICDHCKDGLARLRQDQICMARNNRLLHLWNWQMKDYLKIIDYLEVDCHVLSILLLEGEEIEIVHLNREGE